jgi:maltose-binding protein MalE
VSRTSKHPDEAWDLLVFMTNKENASSYFDLTHRPTARRDLLDREKKDPVYGVFVTQSAYAVSAPLYNEEKFFKVFAGAITDVVDRRKNVSAALKAAEKLVTAMLPAAGFAGPGPYVEPSFRK